MFKIPENQLTLDATKKAIRYIAECVYFVSEQDELPEHLQNVLMEAFGDYFVNEYAEDVYEAAKKNMFYIRRFRYSDTDKMHCVSSDNLFGRPAFMLMMMDQSADETWSTPGSEVESRSKLFEETCLYMLDNGEVYLVDNMSTYMGAADVKYSRERSYLYAQYVEFTAGEFEAWLKFCRKRKVDPEI